MFTSTRYCFRADKEQVPYKKKLITLSQERISTSDLTDMQLFIAKSTHIFHLNSLISQLSPLPHLAIGGFLDTVCHPAHISHPKAEAAKEHGLSTLQSPQMTI